MLNGSRWAPIDGRVAALQRRPGGCGYADVAAYFRLEEAGYKTLANLSATRTIFAFEDLSDEEEFRGIRHGVPTKFIKAQLKPQSVLSRTSIRCEGLHDV